VTHASDDQSMRYEIAVATARREPSMRHIVEEGFLQEDPAEAFDAFRASEHWGRVLWLLRLSLVAPGSRIVDFGGGRGLIAAALAQEGYDVVLCEINPSDVCGTGAAEVLRGRVETDFAILGEEIAALEQASQDAVVCRAVLHHLDPLEDTLRDVLGVLRPGGAFIATDEPTVRRVEDVSAVRDAHPFTRYGVSETAYRVEEYLGTLRRAGFVDPVARFPVPWSSYRRLVRADTPLPVAALGYGVYRARKAIRPTPGDVRSFTAMRPRGGR
jgi:2-polyprenyl-3-methyl-5-hydroxy-6-metoxy-1,4-benzoquinol methylase